MNRLVWIALLLSLGLNLGLGLSTFRRPAPTPTPPGPGVPARFEPGAQFGQPDTELMVNRRVDRMVDELGLDDAQREALLAIHRDAGSLILERRRRMADVRTHLRSVMTAPDAAWSDVQSVMGEHAALQTQLDSTVLDVMFREREVLTPEQLGRYQNFMFPFGGHGRDDRGEGRRRFGRRGDGSGQRP